MIEGVSELYFAYGSNMSRARLIARVPGAGQAGIARLEGFELRFDKPGRDGTAKANLVPAAGRVVWGVVWTVAALDWTALDAFEPGYERVSLDVVDAGERARRAQSYLYRGPRLAEPPLREYAVHLLDGAREHGLPEDYVRELAALCGWAPPAR